MSAERVAAEILVWLAEHEPPTAPPVNRDVAFRALSADLEPEPHATEPRPRSLLDRIREAWRGA